VRLNPATGYRLRVTFQDPGLSFDSAVVKSVKDAP
jgi:hypothetical protein